MNNTSDREETIFNAAVALPAPAERAAYLARACGEDAELRRGVEALLRAHDEAGAFLETAPLAGARVASTAVETADGTSGTQLVPVTEKPGDRIGRYKLLEKIGEGGCGVVYMAEQEEPVRRQVALKVIKLGMDTRSVIARFEAERQALAMMDHPNIAKVLDAGATDTGRPYFVMELVRGIKITDYCDQRTLSTRQRLDLFVQVCHAVQHAHQKGIIHRDLKPSNILVTQHDDVPVPKVIDFGIAKATGQQRLTDKTLFTAFQQFMGTPAYMSPEQAQRSGLDLDTRSDIYALGVLLYELLTGRTPFEAQALLQAGWEEMLRTIRENEPPKPSTRLSTLTNAELTEVARHRESDPVRLESLVRGDLDWIVMKCLEKDRTRRYETANGLARDIQRHLKNEPVTAAAPGAGYRLRKFMRRHRAALATAAALVLLLVAGLVASSWQAVRATRAEQRTRTEAAKSRQVATFLKEMLDGVRPSVALGRDKTLLREILDRAVVRLGSELKNQPGVEGELRLTIARIYRELGEYAKAEAMARESLAIAKRLFGNEHAEVARSLFELAAALMEQSKLPEAEVQFREALAMRRKLLGMEHADVAESLNGLAAVLLKEGKLAEAEAQFREALAMQRKLLANEHLDVATSLNNLAAVLQERGKLAEAETMSREALAMGKRLVGNEHPDVAQSLNNLALVLWKQGKLTEAEGMFREALAMEKRLVGNEHPDVAQSLGNLAGVLGDEDKLVEAEAMQREALAMGKRLLGNEHPDVAKSFNNLAGVLWKQGKRAEAEATYRDGLAMQRKLLGNEHPEVARSLGNLALVLADQGKLAEAERMFREALAMRKKLLGNEHPEVAHSLNGLAAVLRDQRKLAEAELLFREALAMQKKLLGNEHPDVARSLHNLAMVLAKQGKLPEAETMQREALAMKKKLLGNSHPEVAESLGNLALVLQAQSKLAEAETMQREALALQRKLLGNEHPDVASSLNNLAGVLWKQGKLAEAETMHREALALRKKLLGNEHQDVAGSLNNLAAVLQTQGKLAEAEPLFREALAMQRKLLGKEHPDVAQSVNNLATVLLNQGKLAEAEAMLREGLAMRKKLLGDVHPDVAESLNNLAGALQVQGKLAEAETMQREAAFVRLSPLGVNRDRRRLDGSIQALTDAIQKGSVESIYLLARSFLFGQSGRWQAAATDLLQVTTLVPNMPWFSLGPLLLETGNATGYINFRGRLLLTCGLTEDPPTAAATAMALLLQPTEIGLATASQLAETAVTGGTNQARLAYFQLVKALAEYRQGRFASAGDWSQKSLAGGGANPVDAVAASAVLAMAQHRMKQSDEARRTVAQAVEAAQTKLPRLESGALGENWPEWLIAHILLREAQTLIAGPAVEYKAKAEKGDAEAQNNLGICYHEGQGVAKDYVEAVKWFRKAAEQNLASAQNNLGICYHEGQDVAKDEVEAVKWFRKAAEQNYGEAQTHLGFCYHEGQGVAKDDTEAVKWFHKAAEQNHAEAQNALGYCYAKGQGVAKDDTEAVKWYRKAAEQDYAEAQNRLGYFYANGQGVQKDEVEAYAWWDLAATTLKPAAKRLGDLEKTMLPGQIADAQKRAKELRAQIAAKLNRGAK
ncbi:MAG: tetratricopeptide repeat protein [Limisphaerales bacterium]